MILDYISILLIIAAIFLIILELQKARRKAFRISLILLLAISLYFFMHPFTLDSKQPKTEGILLNTNFQKSTLDSLLKANGMQTVVSLVDSKYDQVNDISQLNRRYPLIDSWHLLGNALNSAELNELRHAAVKYYPSQASDGIINISAKKSIHVGDVFEIKGQYRNESQLIDKLSIDYGIRKDSISIEAGLSDFRFTYRFKQSGKILIDLVEKKANQIVNTQQLAVVVKPIEVQRILILSDFPSFELRQLKNWLAEKKHEVLWRSKISKSKYRYEFINTARQSIIRLSAKFLADVDLIISDAKSLKAMSGSEKQLIKNSISNEALSLLLLWDSSYKNSNWLRFQTRSIKERSFSLNGRDYASPKEIRFSSSGVRIQSSADIMPLLISNDKQLIAAKHSYGLGFVAMMAANQLYSLRFKELNDVYDAIWSDIFSKIISSSDSQRFIVDQQFPYKNESLRFSLISQAEQPIALLNESDHVYLEQLIWDSQQWRGQLWPANEGWQSLSTQSDSSRTDFYVYPDRQWKSYSQEQNRINLTQFEFETKQGNDVKTIPAAVNPLWFFLLAILSLSALWFEEKF